MKKKNVRWALVLSGGGARGLAHVGVLKALEERGCPPPALIVGTSMGAIVGGLRACGMDAAALERFATTGFDIRDYLDNFAFKMVGPAAKLVQAGQALANLAFKPGIDSGKKVLALLEDLTERKDFSDLDIPFRCNAVDLVSGKHVVLSEGPVALAIRASISFPAFFEPVAAGDAALVDGGIANNLPVGIARDLGFRRILAVDVGGGEAPTAAALKTGSAVIYRSFEIATQAANRENAAEPTVLIEAKDDSSPFDFVRARRLIDLGEKRTRDAAPLLDTFFDPSPFAAAALALGAGKRKRR